jgi:hypothetical protein
MMFDRPSEREIIICTPSRPAVLASLPVKRGRAGLGVNP